MNSFSVIVHPSGPLGGYVQAPPSKNYTTRLILGAALAEGRSVIGRPAANDDALALVSCCRALGAGIREEGENLIIDGVAGRPANPGRLNPGNAGAVLRLLLGTACLAEGEIVFETDYKDSLGKRPNEDLLQALRQLGAEAEGTGPEGMLPIRIQGGRQRMRGGRVVISGARSSQFLSSLLYLAPYLEGDSDIFVGEADKQGNLLGEPIQVSRPLIDQTLDALGQFDIKLRADFLKMNFLVPGGQCGRSAELVVNGDWPSTAALMAAVAAAGGMATIYGLFPDAQGERRCTNYLSRMGCIYNDPSNPEMVIHSKGELNAANFNGDLATDAVLALMGAACLAKGKSRFSNVANLSLKECDRIREPIEELRKIGVKAEYGDDWIEITGNPEGYAGGIEVDSHGDHRVIQLLTIVGMRCTQGLTIRRAEHISKSYPDFFEDMQSLGVKLKRVAG